MQNIENKLSNKFLKIINIKSEVLYREAEDDLFYFNKKKSAQKKLLEAISLTPSHTKSIMLAGDIYFMDGKIEDAINLYYQANSIFSNNTKILARIANCLYVMRKFKEAIEYSNKAIELLNNDEFELYAQLIEIKINALVEIKNYRLAYISFIQAQNLIDSASLKNIFNTNYELINEKLKVQKKLKESSLKIV